MGIAPYKTFTFDGESSGNYGVYITGTGVFNAPERSVDMVEIAGRNGSFALDKGKFENIEVKYKVGIVDDSEADFADRVSDFRNWLCSKVGYCRLEDEYNPNEYRMAVFSSGLELEHDLLIAGEAEITFNCKPQRWLTSGEIAVSVADGGTLDNPTMFESEPLLAVEGYGNINFNGYDIDIENVPLGQVQMCDGIDKTFASSLVRTERVSIADTYDLLNNADTMTVSGKIVKLYFKRMSGETASVSSFTITSTTNCTADRSLSGGLPTMNVYIPNCTFAKGTSSSATTSSVSYTYVVNGTSFSVTLSIDTSYDDTNERFEHRRELTTFGSGRFWHYVEQIVPPVYGVSTVSALGNPTYIDCDIGECYKFNSDDEIITLNSAIDIGSDLPVLASGTNTFTYDNTVTELKVTPRWWKV